MKDVICLYNDIDREALTSPKFNESILCDKNNYLFFLILHDFFDFGASPLTMQKKNIPDRFYYGYSTYADSRMSYKIREANLEKISENMLSSILAYNINIIGGIEISRLTKPSEEKILSAAISTYHRTGRSVMICLDIDETFKREKHLTNMLIENGVNSKHIIIAGIVANLQNVPKIDYFAQKGVKFIIRDFFNKKIQENFSFEEQLVTIKQLVRLGLTENIMLSVDIFKEGINKSIMNFKRMICGLEGIGIESSDIKKIIRNNSLEYLIKAK